MTALKVEWLQSRRRVAGWTEECALVSVEMRRAIRYLEAKSAVWIERQSSRSTLSVNLGEGIRAYALRQAALQQELLGSFARDFEEAIHVGDGDIFSRLDAETPLDEDDYTPDDEETTDIL